MFRMAERLEDPKNFGLVASLTDGVTPETELLKMEGSKSESDSTMIDWFQPSQRLVIIARNFCALGKGPQFIEAIRKQLGLTEEQAKVAENWSAQMMDRGCGDAFLRVANIPLGDVKPNIRRMTIFA